MPIPFPKVGGNAILELTKTPTLMFDKNVDIPLKDGGLCRANVYRPHDQGRHPVLMTMGPYGKDAPYSKFHTRSYAEIPDEQQGELSAWETPHPDYWVQQGYVVVRVDERGIGSSPGFLDTMSAQTSIDFFDCIEWAADQEWSTGKVRLLGISYFGKTQWRIAARRPKGLACIIPWEGMTDYYRDRCRQGGILSNGFIKTWWFNQVVTMQYGNPEKRPRGWGPFGPPGPPLGPECIEDELSDEEREANQHDQTIDNRKNRHLDEEYYRSRTYDLGDIDVPTLSVANLGGNTLHLRGNVVGYLEAGRKNKWLWFIAGRHDLSFFFPHYVKLQKSFLDAWLKNEDDRGWQKGPNNGVPAVNLLIRKGNPGFGTLEADVTFESREEMSWPIERTKYQRLHLHPSSDTKKHSMKLEPVQQESKLTIDALGRSDPLNFKMDFDKETELAGHLLANFVVGVARREDGTAPNDIDLFCTLRHFDANGKQIFYTGTAGDPVDRSQGGAQRTLASDRREESSLPRLAAPPQLLEQGCVASGGRKPYNLLVEVWPTAVVISPGSSLVFEVATGDTQGCGIFTHDEPTDRSEESFAGKNVFYFGPEHENWLQIPVV